MIENLFGGGGGGGGTVDTITAGTGISVNSTNPANPIITNTSLNTDETAKVSANDTTAGYLNGKLVAGSGISLTENNNGANETLTIASTVTPGVTGFTGTQNVASPNNTVNASRLLVDAGTTNADAVVQPKGTGAFQLQLADGTTAGGNKRGTNAIDLQTTRSSNSQVASGANSVVIGRNNTASGAGAVAIGFGCTAAAADAIALGANSTASNQKALAGNSSTAAGEDSCSFNRANTGANALRSFAIGQGATTQQFQFAHGTTPFTTAGDAQYERYVLQRITATGGTPTEMATDGSPATNTRMVIPNDTTWVFHGFVVGRNTGFDNDSAGYEIKGVIDNNATTVAFVGTPTVTALAEDTIGWDVTVAADNINKALVVNVSGSAGTSIRWVATVHITKVTG